MTRSKVLPLNISVSSRQHHAPCDCEIQRSRRKTLALYIKHRKLVVRCPYHASKREIGEFISANTDWIEQQLLEEAQREREILRVERGGKIFYRARELTIDFRESRKQKVFTEGDQYIIQGYRLTPARARELVEDDLIDKASEYIIPRARGLSRYLGVEHKIREIRLRKTRSKWGHCTSEGVLQYNWLIMLAPYSIIDYMITHEVCHLVHMDHSRNFWNLVQSICPGYKNYEDWLKQNEHRFWF